jgi:hypothetical protein
MGYKLLEVLSQLVIVFFPACVYAPVAYKVNSSSFILAADSVSDAVAPVR